MSHSLKSAEVNPGTGFDQLVQQKVDENNPLNDVYAYCMGDAAVYRISFALACFFFVQMIGVYIDRTFHYGWWGLKIFFYLAFLVSMFFVENNVFDNGGYAVLARIASVIFLILQVFMLIEFAYKWNDSWSGKAVEGSTNGEITNKGYVFAMLGCSLLLYTISWVGIVYLYIGYAGCEIGMATITTTMVAVVLMFFVTLFREKLTGVPGSLLPVAVVSTYLVFLNWSALESNPDWQCRPLEKSNHAGDIAISCVIATISIMWSSYSTSKNVKKVIDGEDPSGVAAQGHEDDAGLYAVEDADGKTVQAKDLDRKGDEKKEEEEKDKLDVPDDKLWLFHLIMMTAAMYMCMVVTNWGVQETFIYDSDTLGALNATGNATNVRVADHRAGETAMWVKVVSEWVTLVLFAWTLIAPAILKGRQFSDDDERHCN